jgi:hypothetical protein
MRENAVAGKIPPVSAHEPPSVAFSVAGHRPVPIEILVNFGLFAGRRATNAEIDRLAELLLDLVAGVTIVAEERNEFSHATEASVYQVRIELAPECLPVAESEHPELELQLLERADYWARTCIKDRHSDLTDL